MLFSSYWSDTSVIRSFPSSQWHPLRDVSLCSTVCMTKWENVSRGHHCNLPLPNSVHSTYVRENVIKWENVSRGHHCSLPLPNSVHTKREHDYVRKWRMWEWIVSILREKFHSVSLVCVHGEVEECELAVTYVENTSGIRSHFHLILHIKRHATLFYCVCDEMEECDLKIGYLWSGLISLVPIAAILRDVSLCSTICAWLIGKMWAEDTTVTSLFLTVFILRIYVRENVTKWEECEQRTPLYPPSS